MGVAALLLVRSICWHKGFLLAGLARGDMRRLLSIWLTVSKRFTSLSGKRAHFDTAPTRLAQRNAELRFGLFPGVFDTSRV